MIPGWLKRHTWPTEPQPEPGPEEREIRRLIEYWLRDNAPGVENARVKTDLLRDLHLVGRQDRKPYLADLSDRRMRDICHSMLLAGLPVFRTLDGYFWGGGTKNYARDYLAFIRMMFAKVWGFYRAIKAARFAIEEERRRNSWKKTPRQMDLIPMKPPAQRVVPAHERMPA